MIKTIVKAFFAVTAVAVAIRSAINVRNEPKPLVLPPECSSFRLIDGALKEGNALFFGDFSASAPCIEALTKDNKPHIVYVDVLSGDFEKTIPCSNVYLKEKPSRECRTAGQTPSYDASEKLLFDVGNMLLREAESNEEEERVDTVIRKKLNQISNTEFVKKSRERDHNKKTFFVMPERALVPHKKGRVSDIGASATTREELRRHETENPYAILVNTPLG